MLKKLIFSFVFVLTIISNCIVSANEICDQIIDEEAVYIAVVGGLETKEEHESTFTVSYQCSYYENVDVILNYDQNQINVNKSDIDESGMFSINYTVYSLGETGCEISIELEEVIIKTLTIYIYSTEEYDYVSHNSMSCAKRLFVKEIIETTGEDYVDYQDFIYKDSNVFEVNNISSSIYNELNYINAINEDNFITVSLTLEWEDSNGNYHPVKNIFVEIVNNGIVLDSGYSSNSGVCSFAISGDLLNGQTLDCDVRISSKNEYIKIESSVNNVDVLYTGKEEISISSNSESNSFLIQFGYDDNDFSKSVQIHQALTMMGDYVYLMKEEKISQTSAIYPNNSDSCYYLSGKIYIRENAFSKWDVVMHEYGHYINDVYDLRVSTKLTNHYANSDHIVEHGKTDGMHFAWSEGLATYLATSAQKLLDDSIPRIPTVGDNFYTNTTNCDLKNCEFGGVGCEEAITGLLLSLSDDDDTDAFSNSLIDFQYIFDLIIDNKPHTLNDFIQCLYLDAKIPNYEYAEILAHFNVAPSIEELSFELYDFPNSISLYWNANGGDGDDNDTFNVYIYSDDLVLIKKYTNITNTYYDINADELNYLFQILKEEKIYWQVEGFATTTPVTGGFFSGLKEINLSYDSYNVSNYSTTKVASKSIEVNDNSFIEITSEYSKYYEVIINGSGDVDLFLYDENFNELSIVDTDIIESKEHAIIYLSNGTYFLKIANNSLLVNDISLKIISRTNYFIGLGNNDILLNTHNYNNDIYPSNDYRLTNNNIAGFYRVTLEAVKMDNTESTYMENSIVIKDSLNQTIINKYDVSNYNALAKNKNSENSFVVYLEDLESYYISISYDSAGLNSLMLSIESVENKEINLFNLSETTNQTINIINSGQEKSDYFKLINLNQAGSFNFNYSCDLSDENNYLFVFGKVNYDIEYNDYTFTHILIDKNGDIESSVNNPVLLTEGIYYVGYFNKDASTSVSFSLTRLVTEYGSSYLLPDPYEGYEDLSGTEVRLNNGEYNSNEITQGFTRLIYLDNGESRLDYYWYSSNEEVARITDFGTVMALDVKYNRTVKVMAVKMSDPSVVFVKEFVILVETEEFLDSPIEYSLEITATLSNNDLDQIDISSLDLPIKWIQYFTWISYSSYLSVDQYGVISSYSKGIYQVIGTYKLNPRIRIYVTISVE